MAMYHLSADKRGRIVIPKSVREHSLPGYNLGFVVDVPSVPGNHDMLAPSECVCLRIITEDKYNDFVFKIETLPPDSFKRDLQQYFELYVCLQPVDEGGCISIPQKLLKEVLDFDPPGQLVFMEFPGEARLTTFALHDEACRRSMREMMNNPVAREDLGL